MFKRLILISVILFGLAAGPLHAYWIWTPKTGKWVNPKTLPKPTPKEQFEYAMSFYNIKKFKEARIEFKKLLKAYPKSFEASESQYYLGRVEEEQGNIYEAYLAYQMLIDKYPFSERIQEVNEREYKIAERFMAGEKRKAMGVALPVENPAIEIFTRVVENSTYGPLAPKAQYKLGLLLKSLMRYYEAEEAFNKLLANYPDSEWAEAAKFQLAESRAAESRGPEYDQGATTEAKQKFEDFIKSHPDAALSREAQKNIQQLRVKEAASNYNIGRFYEKQKAYEAAKIYYDEVLNSLPDSDWAKKASDRLEIIEKLTEKKNVVPKGKKKKLFFGS
ncbi:MAG: tetratricopeptide repeat protein [Candidatus Omnitrophica bacterium]|nr:tetratricopeptide repeat protein [Candidatus Omnitrophota bacterium]